MPAAGRPGTPVSFAALLADGLVFQERPQLGWTASDRVADTSARYTGDMPMIDGPFGATLPVGLELPTTADDEFESLVLHAVGLRLPGLTISRGSAFPTTAGRYIRPDIVVTAPGTQRVLLVADAKRRQRVSPRDIDKLARYRSVLGAWKAAIVCLVGTAISPAASMMARRRRIAIIRHE
jgi:hypothetical protein